MKATILMFLAVAPVAGRVDALKSYKAMPTETDMVGLIISAATMVVQVLVAVGVLLVVLKFWNWLDARMARNR